MGEPSGEEVPDLDEQVREVAGENPNWFNADQMILRWLIDTVQRLVPLDEQAVDEWNKIIHTREFDNLTRHLGQEYNKERMMAELEQLAESADIYEGNLDGNDEEGS